MHAQHGSLIGRIAEDRRKGKPAGRSSVKKTPDTPATDTNFINDSHDEKLLHSAQQTTPQPAKR